MLKQILLVTAFIGLVLGLNGQSLENPSFSFSHKKLSYLTLKDGTEVQGYIKDLDRKKGLIEEVKLESEKGKKTKYSPADIEFMYLPPSGFDKMNSALDVMYDAQKWADDSVDSDLLKDGYTYFENAMVQVKKKKMELLMQVLNPGFSKDVKVYHDPLAKESASLGVGGISVAGGNAKSYYVSKGGATATLLTKKDYKKSEFDAMWKGCKAVTGKYSDVKWTELVQHIMAYSECK